MKKWRLQIDADFPDGFTEAEIKLRVLDLLDVSMIRPRVSAIVELFDERSCPLHGRWSCFLCKWSSGRPIDWWLKNG